MGPAPTDSRLRGNDVGVCGNDVGATYNHQSAILDLRFLTVSERGC